MNRSSRLRTLRAALTCFAALAAGGAGATTYTVNDAGNLPDSNTNDNTCSTATPANGTSCTLRAAIQEANAHAGPHVIKFAPAVLKVVLVNGSLPTATAPITFDGTTVNALSGGRVEIDGGGVFGCFSLADTTTAVNNKGATGSVIKNFVIRHCSGNGIDLSGQGYTITGNRIGTNVKGDSNSSAADANSGHGIAVSGTVPLPGAVPNLQSLLATLPDAFAGVQALQGTLQAALTALANPTLIAGNLVSGNNSNGIDLTAQGTVNVIITGNIIGLSQDGLSKVGNGRGGSGGAGSQSGVHIGGTAYGNFVGPGNIISGNPGNGITLDPGAVILPNFIAGNLIGLGSAPTDVGNGNNGIYIDTTPKTQGAGAQNPTGISAIIGPGNTISDNDSTAPSNDLDFENNDTAGGVIITSNSSKVRLFGNVIGLATFPAGSTPLGQLNYGNSGNGVVVTTSNNDISYNLILSNGRHGILVRGSGVSGNTIKGNYIGVSVPTGLDAVIGLGNSGDGIHIDAASSTTIGGSGMNDANVIAANGRNGIALRNGSSSNGYANLMQRNQVYGNARGTPGIGIDLEHPNNQADGLATLDNPGINYANYDQHRPSICGSGNDPLNCSNGKGPLYDGSSTSVQWSVFARHNANKDIRIEFFALPANGNGMKFLGDATFSTDVNGLPTGPGCSGGICTSSTGVGTDTTGMQIVATTTDLMLADVPPTGDQPNPNPLSPINNTSEFSDPVVAVRKLAITTMAPLPGGATNASYNLTFGAIGGSGTYINWQTTSGNLPTGLALNPNSGQLSGTATAAGTFNFTVQVTDSVGNQAVAGFSITITQTPPLTITTPSPLPNGTQGTAYSQQFAATGGNGAAGNWQVMTGNLPQGLAIAPASGLLSGTPAEVGTFSFNLQVTDQQPTTAIRAYSLTIVPPPVPLAITTASPLPGANQNVSYSTSFAATGGSGIYTNWSVAQGTSLPAGLSLDGATGVLSGKPTGSGSANFTIRVTDSKGASATKAFTLTITAQPVQPAPVLNVTPSEIDFGNVNVGKSSTINVLLTNVSPDPTPLIIRPSSSPVFVTGVGTCPSSLNAGQSCFMTVTFTPTAGGGTVYTGSSAICSATFGIPPNVFCFNLLGGSSYVIGVLSFKGTGSGTLAQVSPRRIDFGSQVLASQTNVSVAVTNNTGATINLSTSALSNPAQFSIPSNGCGATLAANASCTVTFRYSPNLVGAASSAARITVSNASSSENYDISLAGTGVLAGPATFTAPMLLDFGRVQVGGSSTISVNTVNASGVTLAVTASPFVGSDATTWSVTPFAACVSLANGASCRDDYKFSPRLSGTASINTELTASGSGVNQNIPLALTGVGVGSLVTVAPQRLDFGNLPIVSTGIGQVVVTNTSLTSVTLSMSSATPFTMSTNCGATVASGASCTVNFFYSATLTTPTGPVSSQATIAFDNGAGTTQLTRVNLIANIVDNLFNDGFE